MSVTDELLQNNAAYAASFDKGDLPLPPAKKVAVLACMDARISPYGVLGLKEGDAHVIRNAGGVATDDAIRSLAISQRLLGTEEIVLIHHSDCGMLDVFRRPVQKADPGRGRDQAPLGSRGLRGSRRGCPPIGCPHKGEPIHPEKQSVRGFVYDVSDGRLREVV